jgi:hypothetical protein
MHFLRNTFYDMPYMKSIFTMSYADTELGRNAEITFDNNTVCVTGPTGGLINTGTYLGQESVFNFNNNLLLLPNWINDLNIHPDSIKTSSQDHQLPLRYHQCFAQPGRRLRPLGVRSEY